MTDLQTLIARHVTPKQPEPKVRLMRVTDPAEIAAIERNGLRDPIGSTVNGETWAEAHSLRQFRGLPVEFNV